MSPFGLTLLLFMGLTGPVKERSEKESSVTKKHRSLLFLFVLTLRIEFTGPVKERSEKEIERKKGRSLVLLFF